MDSIRYSECMIDDDWRKIVDSDIHDIPLDWSWLNDLDVDGGIGRGLDGDPIDALGDDYETRSRLEPIIAAMSRAWMFDRDKEVRDYSDVLHLVKANRRLSDEIDALEGMVPEESRPLDRIITHEDKTVERKGRHVADWHDRYLPGRDVNGVLGVDLETTGLDPYRDYVIDAGYEYMDMWEEDYDDNHYHYLADGYHTMGAWGQERASYGVPELRERLGNPAEDVSGITTESLHGIKPLDEDEEAQSRLLTALKSAPFVAHNALFEHKHFMVNLKGYAEAYRNGEITIIDTMVMSRKWAHDDGIQNGNKLDAYAIHYGGLDRESSERHLGLEDSHIMLIAMRNHLHELQKSGKGPWGEDGIDGIGGKTCR